MTPVLAPALRLRPRLGALALPLALAGLACAALAYSAWAGAPFDAGLAELGSEGPLLGYLFCLLWAPLRPRWWRPLVAALPLAWLYGAHDHYLRQLGTVPNLTDLALLGDLLEAVGPARGVGVLLLLALPPVAWLAGLQLRPPHRPGWRAAALSLPLLIGLGAAAGWPVQSFEQVNRLTPDEEWSDQVTAERWGRLYGIGLRELRRRAFAAQLTGYTPLERSPLRLPAPLLASLQPRNVHLVLLESFVDPRRLTAVRFSRPPLDEEFTAWADPGSSTSISPSFGGETARAEFEVLCGVPSLRLYGIEFLAFSGSPTYCLPRILHDAGWETVLSFPYGPVFFNSQKAYRGLGFGQRLYGDRFTPPGREAIRMLGQTYLDDADFLPQNVAKVRTLLAGGRPFLNYVVTMFGHWPFEYDEAAHPPQVEVTPAEPELAKLVNLAHHRSRALLDYVRTLQRLDPRGIIVLFADHLPPLEHGFADYRRLGYRSPGEAAGGEDAARAQHENFLLVVVDGRVERLPPMRHFDLPHWLLDRLTAGRYCRERACDFGRWPVDPAPYLAPYQTLLGLSVAPPDRTPR